jgi:CRISPR-associated protein Csy2
MSNQYTIINRIYVTGANAQSAWSIVSGPSPLAIQGFVRNMALQCGLPDSHKINVAILHHDIEFRGEFTKFRDFLPAQYRGACVTSSKDGPQRSKDYAKDSFSMGLQPTASCNITLTLIIEGLESASLEELTKRISCARIAGGQIQSFGKIERVPFESIMSKVSAGFFLKDQSCLLRDIPADQKLEQFMRLLLYKEGVVKEERQWLVPMALGYLPITEPVVKVSARADMPHAYVEPLVGIIEYISKNKVKKEDTLPSLFWGYAQIGKAFVVTNI